MIFNMSLSPVALTGEVVNDCRRGDGLPSARRTLDQTERSLQHRLYSINLLCLFFNKKQTRGQLQFAVSMPEKQLYGL